MSKSTHPLRIEPLETRDTPGAGALDTSFGTGGKLTASFAGFPPSDVTDVAALSDGKFLAAGSTHESNQDLALARYNADGSFDGTFANNGEAITDFGANDLATTMLVESDGTIVVAGHTDGGAHGDLIVARYTADGALDTTFGTGGKVITDTGSDATHSFDETAENVTVQSDGKILVQATRTDTANNNAMSTVLVRYNADGTLDTAFGTNGVQQAQSLQNAEFAGAFSSALPLAGGKTLVVGTTQSSGDGGDFLVKRFNADGTLDTTFGTNGRVAINIGQNVTSSVPGFAPIGSADNAYRAAVQPSGHIVVVGTTNDGNGKQFAMVRLNTDGSLDTSFGTSGKVITGFDQGGDVALRVNILPTGQILVMGTSNVNDTAGVAIAQYDGTESLPPAVPTTTRLLAVGIDGARSLVNVYDSATGHLKFQLQPYNRFFTGGVRVATADVNGDGTEDIITGAGLGGGPHIKVYDGTNGSLITEFMAYSPTFFGGVYVAAADLNGDGRAEIITGAGLGGGPHVAVFDGMTGTKEMEFYAYFPEFTGGVRVAAGDVTGDGQVDIVTGAGKGGGPHVRIFSGQDGHELPGGFYAFSQAYAGGVNVAVGNLEGTGTGTDDIIVSQSGADLSGHVHVYEAGTFKLRLDIVPFTPFSSFPSQLLKPFDDVRIASADVDGDGIDDLVVASGPHRGSQVIGYKGTTLVKVSQFTAFDPAHSGGAFVG